MVPEGFEVGVDVEAARQYCSKFYQPLVYEGQTGLCLLKHGEVVAAVLYDGFNGHNVWMQVAGSPGTPWLTRAALRWSMIYPFHQMGVGRISAMVDANNKASSRFCEHLGFVHECTLPRASLSGGGLMIYRMFREECRYA
jgi:hypothetical protein